MANIKKIMPVILSIFISAQGTENVCALASVLDSLFGISDRQNLKTANAELSSTKAELQQLRDQQGGTRSGRRRGAATADAATAEAATADGSAAAGGRGGGRSAGGRGRGRGKGRGRGRGRRGRGGGGGGMYSSGGQMNNGYTDSTAYNPAYADAYEAEDGAAEEEETAAEAVAEVVNTAVGKRPRR
ncbi:MAG: hypothetical protein LBO73_04270 [Holosporaceae bacterium]|nr:hypothetical protein [Holosporaceae bacterium]